MSRTAALLFVVSVLGFAVASARAGDGTSVEERLAGVEKRLEGVARWIKGSGEQVEPALQRSRLAANETAAIATLRVLVSCEAQVQASSLIDLDQDGVGEYAGLLEMSAANAGRMAKPLNPPVL